MSARSRLPRATVWLALVLAAVAGFVDVCAYLSFGAYAANMTGNAIALAIGLTHRGSGAVWERAATILFFFGGSLMGAALVGDTESTSLVGRRLGRVLTAEAALLLVVVLLAGTKAHLGAVPVGLALLALATGMQNASLRRAGPISFRTTHMTGRLTRTAEALAALARWLGRHGRNRSPRRRWALLRLAPRQKAARTAALVAGLLAAFLTGACAGALALAAWGEAALVAPAVALIPSAWAARLARSRPAEPARRAAPP
jgi:uncharacterized membrane protein YoaK (UPF0700 family)